MATQGYSKGWRIGTAWGAPVIVQVSTLLFVAGYAALVVYSSQLFTIASIVSGVSFAVALMFSVYLHEWAHAAAARGFKLSAHEIVITLWGGHTTFTSKATTPMASGSIAAAGPAMNILLSVVAYAGQRALAPNGHVEAVAALGWFGAANLFLAIFNLLPGLPLDGGRVLESLAWAGTGNRVTGATIAARTGQAVAIAVVLWTLAPLLSGGAPTIAGVLIGFVIAQMLWRSASDSLRTAKAGARLSEYSVIAHMLPAVSVPAAATVSQALATALTVQAQHVIVADDAGVPAGRFVVGDALRVPEDLRTTTSVRAVTVPMPGGAVVTRSAQGQELVEAVRAWYGKTDVLVVAERGGIVGVVKVMDLIDALRSSA